jgi:hypothetical protein
MQHNEESQLHLKDEQTDFKEKGHTCNSKIDEIINFAKDFSVDLDNILRLNNKTIKIRKSIPR